MNNNQYSESGVDIDQGNFVVSLIKKHIEKTKRVEVLNNFGSFSAGFRLPTHAYKKPILMSGTDGVGTKVKIAVMMNRHDTIGIDLVAMCANDILTSGAQALFFLDYLAQSKINPERVEAIVKGIAEGCIQCGAALVGGETAEMPDMYAAQDYDLAGFIVGMVEEDLIINGSAIQEGDILVGVASSGLHSNGYSLVRQILFKSHHFHLDYIPPFSHQSLGEVLLTPTRIYEPVLRNAIQKGLIKGMAHITGGGLTDNIPRILPESLQFQLDAWNIPAIFLWLRDLGNISDDEMKRVFNLGIGMVLAIDPNHFSDLQESIQEPVFPIGVVIKK